MYTVKWPKRSVLVVTVPGRLIIKRSHTIITYFLQILWVQTEVQIKRWKESDNADADKSSFNRRGMISEKKKKQPKMKYWTGKDICEWNDRVTYLSCRFFQTYKLPTYTTDRNRHLRITIIHSSIGLSIIICTLGYEQSDRFHHPIGVWQP